MIELHKKKRHKSQTLVPLFFVPSEKPQLAYNWTFFLSIETFQVLKTWKVSLREKMSSSMPN